MFAGLAWTVARHRLARMRVRTVRKAAHHRARCGVAGLGASEKRKGRGEQRGDDQEDLGASHRIEASTAMIASATAQTTRRNEAPRRFAFPSA